MTETRDPRGAIDQLSPRVREALALASQHLPSKEIARRMALSPFTVDEYLAEARKRLGAASRREAVRMLVEYEQKHGVAAASDRPPKRTGGRFFRGFAGRRTSLCGAVPARRRRGS